MLIASWNVNSVRIRQDRLLHWLKTQQPQVLCLQELKCEDGAFPWQAVQNAGYHCVMLGQKTYNGVAILSREPLKDVVRGLDAALLAVGAQALIPTDDLDPQARFIVGRLGPLRIASVYVPNGGELGSDKYAYKQVFLGKLRRWLQAACAEPGPLVLCGDFNIVPTAADVRHPDVWEDTVLFNPLMTQAFSDLLTCGIEDALRRHESGPGPFSWWDYRNLGFQKNDGLRIDFVLASAALPSQRAWVDRQERKGDKPSDHAPVCVEFAPL